MRPLTSKVLLLGLLFCTLTVKVLSQTPIAIKGKISGTIIDAQNGEAIPFASAILLNRKTKAQISAVQSDANGSFVITDIAGGAYTFKASYVGYQTMVRDSVAITNTEIKLGVIKMKAAKGNLLKEIAVTAKKPNMQLGIDKKVFSVDQSLVSEGGSATDLLQNIPSVQTDLDGNVSLRGASGVRVLIDGKPSLIAGGDVAQILQSIPASSIESVELVTNPSSKYDAEGQSGIINIILKKNKKVGFNGSLALTAGNRENYNANTSLSFQNKKINLYGNYSYRYGYSLSGGYNNISYFNLPSALAFTNQNTNSRDLDKSHNIKAGIDYYLAEKSVIGFSSNINLRNELERDLLNTSQVNSSYTPIGLNKRTNTEDWQGNSYDLNLDFSQKFKNPKEELTSNFRFAESTSDSYQVYDTFISLQDEQPSNTNDIQRTDRGRFNRNYNLQMDYTVPAGKFGRIETGYRSQIGFSESSTYADVLTPVNNDFNFNYSLSNLFNSKEQVHALYINYQNQIKNFGYQVGLRGEDARLDTRLGAYDINTNLNYTPGKVAYTRLYPSVFLTQKFKGEQQLQLSYSRRVNRPRSWETNPFLDVSDPYNYRQGNPNLLPEDVHAFELSYSKFWQKFSLISSLYLRKTNDLIQRIRTEPDANGITISVPQNVTNSLNTGLELIGKLDLFKSWNFTGNVNLYQRKITGIPALGIAETDGFSYNANLTNNFNLPHSISLQLKGEYNSREVMAQGIRKANYSLDGGAKYDFPNKKASLSFNIRDVFNSRRWMMQTTSSNSIIDFSRYRLGRQASLTFSYRFGKTDFSFKKTKKAEDQNNGPDEEQF